MVTRGKKKGSERRGEEGRRGSWGGEWRESGWVGVERAPLLSFACCCPFFFFFSTFYRLRPPLLVHVFQVFCFFGFLISMDVLCAGAGGICMCCTVWPGRKQCPSSLGSTHSTRRHRSTRPRPAGPLCPHLQPVVAVSTCSF